MRRLLAILIILPVVSCSSRVELNGSSDGRYHTCGYITEQGVTENLSIFWERCGKQ